MPSADPTPDPFLYLADAALRPDEADHAAVRQATARAMAHARGLEQRLREVADAWGTPEEKAVEIVDGALREFGAAAVLSARVAGGGLLELVGATAEWGDVLGAPADRPDVIPLGVDSPLATVVRTGVPVFCESRASLAERYPALAGALERHGVQAVAAVPAQHMGRVQGGVLLCFRHPRRFSPAERALLRALAGRFARALAYARLYYGERSARAEAEAARSAEAEARREAERANRAKDDFLAVVSHELRTPLQAVIGFSELLEAEMAGPLTERQREFVQRIQAGGSHLLHIIEDLLGFSRAQAGKELVHAEPFDPSDTVAQVVAMAAPLADRKRVRLRFEGPPGGVRFRSDPFKVRQIATNLVGNAVKFTGWGEVTVTLEAWDAAGAPAGATGPGAAAARVRLTVRDTGVGIPADQHERVFAPFVQVAAPTTRVAGGTGLGLSIVRQLARLLGGDVRLAESEVGRGSTFVVELPAVAEAPSAAAHEASPNGTPPGAAGVGENGVQPERASRDLAST